MNGPRFRLGIDFGTSTTIAMLQRPDGRVQPLLFDGSPLLSSAVLLGADGKLYTGRDAAHLARSAPERLEPNPKRRIDDTSVLLGDAEVDVRDLISSVLSRVATEAARVAGPVQDVTLTHPANWGQGRRTVLVEAARRLGFSAVELIGEPLAAATYFAHTRGADLPVGSCVLVYDLGAGTCDVTLLRRQRYGFEQVASDGLNDLGGLDVDAAVIAFLQATYGTLWTDAATRRQLWDDVRSAKEMLSRASGTVVMIPALGKEVPLGREQLEGLTRPVLRPSVAMTRALLVDAGIRPAEIAGLFLVGGSSRIPLVATMLHEALGIAPIVSEQPELVVAEGALYLRAEPQTAQWTTAGPAQPVSSAPVSPMPPPSTSTMPVSTMPFAASPVSAAPMSGPPVSGPPVSGPPVSGPPVSGPPGRPPFAAPTAPPGPRPPVAGQPLPARPGRGGGTAVLVGVIVLIGLLVAGVGGFVAYRALRDSTDGTAGDGHSSGPGTATATGQRNAGAAGKYSLAKIPDNLCTTVDITPFIALYDKESGPPTPSRNLTAQIGTASCSATRQHTAGNSVTSGSLTTSLVVYSDASVANTAFGQSRDTAQVNADPAAVKDLGDDAVVYEQKGATGSDKTVITLVIAVKDSNLVWTAYLSATRSDGAGWTGAEKTDLRSRLITSTKASIAKTVTGLV